MLSHAGFSGAVGREEGAWRETYVNGRTAVAVSNLRLIRDTAGRHHDGGICTPPFSYRGNERACG